jgi:hypothetical protein
MKFLGMEFEAIAFLSEVVSTGSEIIQKATSWSGESDPHLILRLFL